MGNSDSQRLIKHEFDLCISIIILYIKNPMNFLIDVIQTLSRVQKSHIGNEVKKI